MPHLFKSPEQKTQDLLEFAKQDNRYNEIVTAINKIGLTINYTWLGNTGSYHPQALNLQNIEDLETKIQHLKETGAAKHTIRLSHRFGKWVMYHTFLHELFHIYQDTLGLFLIPLHINGKPQLSLDEESQITVTLFNEAFAATEAIRASYRLKQKAHPEAWYGALISPDWYKLAKNYAKDIKTSDEETAAKNLFDNWHKSHLKKYYESRTLTPQTSPMKLNGITYESLTDLIPEKHRPSYLTPSNKNALNNIKKGSPLSYLSN